MAVEVLLRRISILLCPGAADVPELSEYVRVPRKEVIDLDVVHLCLAESLALKRLGDREDVLDNQGLYKNQSNTLLT